MPPTRLIGPLDLVVVAVVATGAVLSWIAGPTAHGSRATVFVQGKAVAWWPLEGGVRTDTVVGALGAVAIEHGNGRVRIASSPCPNHLCMRQGGASRLREQLVCVPSRLVVAIDGAGSEDGLDAVH